MGDKPRPAPLPETSGALAVACGRAPAYFVFCLGWPEWLPEGP
jgi:hypothetical protein